MPDFPDLATPAAQATDPPAFESLVERAQRRQRRRTVSGVVVAVALVGAIAGGVTAGQRQSTAPPVSPPAPSPSHSHTHQQQDQGQSVHLSARQVIARGTLDTYAVDADGRVLTVWVTCFHHDLADCQGAWLLRAAGVVHRHLFGTSTAGNIAVAVPAGGFVIAGDAPLDPVVVSPDGHFRYATRGGRGPWRAGDVAVLGGARTSTKVVDPARGVWWPMPAPLQTPVGLGSDADGPWGLTNGRTPFHATVVWEQGGVWRRHTLALPHDSGPGMMIRSGDRLMAAAMPDGVDVTAISMFTVSTDGGRTWRSVPLSTLPFGSVLATAATSNGTLYVCTDSDGGGALYRSVDGSWTHFVRVPGTSGFFDVRSAGDHVVAERGPRRDAVLLPFDASGRRGAPIALR